MRIILALILITHLHLNAQQSPSVALTAGSEFSPVQLMEGQSITENQTVIPTMVWTSEAQIQPQINSYVPPTETSNGLSKDKTLLLVGLLIAISLFYISKKSPAKKTEEQSLELANINFEEEETTKLKKEVWNLIAKQPTIETEIIHENIISTKPESYTQHTYTCNAGALIIKQAYQHPNIGESVLLNNTAAPNGKYKIGLLLSVEVVNGKISKVLS